MIKPSLLARFVTFRKELATLWRAFLAPETPMHLKALMLLVPAYLLSPIDLIPDVIPLLGWVDDFVIIPLLVSWIVGMLPQKVPVYARTADGAKVIDGTYRRR
ncbi:MAG: YkvA family protein [Devosia sp.]